MTQTTDKPVSAWAILGSNQGDRAGAIRRAVFALHAADGIRLVRPSRLYETPPWGDTFQDAFLNAAVELETHLAPKALLDVFQAIERDMGREPQGTRRRWGPRPIDIDLALYADQSIHTERLVVPHPRLAERAFALIPLLEIAPDATEPVTGALYADALARLEHDATRCDDAGPLLFEGNALLEGIDRLATENAETVLLRARSPEETEHAAEALGRALKGGEVFALSGNLGAGKTCLTRGVARGLGINEPITSPSYVLVKSYEGRLTLHHADFYRLAMEEEDAHKGAPRQVELDVATLGLEDYLDDPSAVVAVEWADKLPQWLEPPFILARMHGAGDQPRLILLRRVASR